MSEDEADEEALDEAPVYPNLDFIIHWRGLTMRHLQAFYWFIPVPYITLFFPIVQDIIPAKWVIGLGLGTIAAVVAVQWRQPPETLSLLMQKWTTPDELSAYLDDTYTDLPFTSLNFWSEKEDDVEEVGGIP